MFILIPEEDKRTINQKRIYIRKYCYLNNNLLYNYLHLIFQSILSYYHTSIIQIICDKQILNFLIYYKLGNQRLKILYDLHQINQISTHTFIFKEDARKAYLDTDERQIQQKSKPDGLNQERLKSVLEIMEKVKGLSNCDQQRFLDVMIGGLSNDDSSVRVQCMLLDQWIMMSFLSTQNHSLENTIKQRVKQNRNLIGTSYLGIEKSGLEFAEHPIYGVITICPINMGTGKRQSILGNSPILQKEKQMKKN